MYVSGHFLHNFAFLEKSGLKVDVFYMFHYVSKTKTIDTENGQNKKNCSDSENEFTKRSTLKPDFSGNAKLCRKCPDTYIFILKDLSNDTLVGLISDYWG